MRRVATLATLALFVGCDDDPTAAPDAAIMAPMVMGEAPATHPAHTALPLVVTAAPNEVLTLTVTRGGGALTTDTVTTDAEGHATLPWMLGVAPVDNTVTVQGTAAPDETLQITVRGTLAAPIRAEPFGDVNAFLTAEGHTTSTEDLTFTTDGLLMGAPEGLLHVAADGTTSRHLSSPSISRVWGFAVDAAGTLWGVDSEASRLISIQPDGTVEEALTTDGDQPLAGPNYVAVGPQGRIYLTDPCLGEIIRLDPTTGETAIHRFDLQTEGGPNGLALSPDGSTFYVATENTGLLCQHGDVTFDEPIAGVYRLDLNDFEGAHQPIAEGIGLFGDGLALDIEGNLYVVVDTEENVQLKESLVVVFPNGEAPGTSFLVAGEKVLFANVAFGQGDYGDTTLYIALLAIAPFTTGDSRGLERFDVGIAGQPLLP
jgi:sugar lactone lactonase YvrE